MQKIVTDARMNVLETRVEDQEKQITTLKTSLNSLQDQVMTRGGCDGTHDKITPPTYSRMVHPPLRASISPSSKPSIKTRLCSGPLLCSSPIPAPFSGLYTHYHNTNCDSPCENQTQTTPSLAAESEPLVSQEQWDGMARDAREFSSTVRNNTAWLLKEVGGVYREIASDVYNSAKNLAQECQDVYFPVYDDHDDQRREDYDEDYDAEKEY